MVRNDGYNANHKQAPINHVMTHTASMNGMFAVFAFGRLDRPFAQHRLRMMIVLRHCVSRPFAAKDEEHKKHQQEFHESIHSLILTQANDKKKKIIIDSSANAIK